LIKIRLRSSSSEEGKVFHAYLWRVTMSGAIVQHTLGEQDNFSGISRLFRKTYTVTIVCSNPILGLGLKNILSDSCFSPTAIINCDLAASVTIPDAASTLILVDWCTTQSNTAEAIRTIRDRFPEVKIAAVADQFSSNPSRRAWIWALKASV